MSTPLLQLVAIAIGIVFFLVILAFAWAVRRELNATDEWWQPSESGALAKRLYDEKQAVKEQNDLLRRINQPTYTTRSKSCEQ